ncbi:restriction endonuclease subunit S [Salmonella enterica subsp. salamae]|uniref:Restriction endonuclease subunit S n=3 Tax=Salmonella enterica TaxID=28901 RepID=A0A8F7UP39_SALER|nr:restriction endonuclease subunit S [Salmonella enterica]EAA4084486.1 restriction endonuclease subunit S [Salmonella enterica subsp. salamae serovar Sofia]EDS8305380.1 restriction endonuclease subunit S [Salmonella enterica subsp. enterica serovar Java]EDT7499319.1 restriction endonuclease subunit S [Salmonella enterica subsp. enterica serovar Schleissheim]EAZ1915605.1 restriction endonuclease subunit S [Salmonella enterica]EBA5232067.1 restriction endonuclease subunit S [Salmonella enterica
MGSKWTFKSLNELGVQLIDCMHKTPSAQVSGVPYIGIPQMKNGEIDFEASPRLISESDYKLWTEKAKPQYGDIILSRRCNPGETAFVSGSTQFALGQNLVILRTNGLSITAEYLRWALNSSYWWDEVEKYKNPGAIFDSLKCGDIPNFQIPAPPLHIQNKISSILDSLTNRINLNNKVNQTLEQMSQTLFKSWFVDFDPVIDNALDAGNPIPEALQSRAELRQKVRNSADFKPLPADIRALFPAEFEETELGWVPKGWITTSFNDLIELIGGGTPKTSVEEYWNGDIPWFSVVDAPNESDVYVLTTEKNITTEGLNNSSAKLLRKGTTIISARGTVGKCAMVAVPMAMNQSCYGVIGKNNISDEYVYFQLKNAVQTLQQMGHGSVFNTITRDTFKNIKVPFCNEELTNSYSLLVKNYFSKILNNNYQNIALTNLRDTLLPKLISGELSLEDLPDLANQTEPV